MTGWKKIAFVVIATLAVAWCLHFLWARHIRHQQAAIRRVEYEKSLTLAKRTIPLGTSRGNLRALAKSQGLDVTETQFNGAGSDDLMVEIGRDPSPKRFCAYDGVYLDFKFPAVLMQRSDEDLDAPLQSIELVYWSRGCSR